MAKRRYRKLYASDLLKEIKYYQGENFAKDFSKTYYYSKILDMLLTNNTDLYIKEPMSKVKSIFIIRLTYPLYIIFNLLFLITGAIYWLLTGKYLSLDTKNKLRQFIEKWDDLGGFGLN